MPDPYPSPRFRPPWEIWAAKPRPAADPVALAEADAPVVERTEVIDDAPIEATEVWAATEALPAANDGHAGGANAAALAVLLCQSGNGEEPRIEIREGTLVIGRQGDVVLKTSRASKEHAEIRARVDEDGPIVEIVDRSRNGTWVNQARLEPNTARRLANLDVIKIADVVYQVYVRG